MPLLRQKMKIRIVKLGSIGDIVHTLPALAAIHHGLPDAEIWGVVEKRSAEILRGNPMISRLIEIDTKSLRRNVNPRKLLSQVRSELQQLRDVKFDVALDFQGLLKSALVGKLSGAKKIYGFSSRSLKEPASRIFLDKAERIAAKMHGDFAILKPGGGWPAKLWPAERFGQLADLLWKELGLASVVTYGPGEEELAARVVNSAVSQKAFAANISLKGFFALAQKAAIYVGGDTGPTHLAVAANTPVVGIFGPTEWWRNGSPRKEDVGVKHEGIAAHVCTRRSDSNCPCMDIEAEKVFQAVRGRLNKGF